jgi:hypothetical protein
MHKHPPLTLRPVPPKQAIARALSSFPDDPDTPRLALRATDLYGGNRDDILDAIVSLEASGRIRRTNGLWWIPEQ